MKRVQLPSFALGTVIDGVKAISPRNVWAVGEESTKNLVLHWNGRSWKKVQVQNPGTVENIFYDIDALSADEIWMVGESRNSSDLIHEARALHCCWLAATPQTPVSHSTPRAEPGRGSCRSCRGRSGWPPRCRPG